MLTEQLDMLLRHSASLVDGLASLSNTLSEFLVLVLYLGVQTLENRENLAFEGLGGILVRV